MDQNILVVDDTPDSLRLLVGILTGKGYKVRPAPSGTYALTTIQKERPDLILLDIMMPKMDGFEVCRRLKADEHTQNIPVIFISALDKVFDKVTAFAAGGVDYITKPFEIEEVLARVSTHLTICNLQRSLQEKNEELQEKNDALEAALTKVKLLSGLLPICSHCKNIRNDDGYWQSVEVYIRDHSEADFSHGLCPNCMQELYPDLHQKMNEHREDILDALDELGQATLKDISAVVGLPESNTLNRLEFLTEEKQVEQVEIEGTVFYKRTGSGEGFSF
jgi:CheY-like chemotaxis protein